MILKVEENQNCHFGRINQNGKPLTGLWKGGGGAVTNKKRQRIATDTKMETGTKGILQRILNQ